MKIYVASSRRNNLQPLIVEWLRHEGYEVYDFKNPINGNHGFHWSEIGEHPLPCGKSAHLGAGWASWNG